MTRALRLLQGVGQFFSAAVKNKSCTSKTMQIDTLQNKVSQCRSSSCQFNNQPHLMNLRCLCTTLNLLRIE